MAARTLKSNCCLLSLHLMASKVSLKYNIAMIYPAALEEGKIIIFFLEVFHAPVSLGSLRIVLEAKKDNSSSLIGCSLEGVFSLLMQCKI